MKGIENSECLHNRLKKIIGQVQAVDRAIDTDISCEDVITQINAAKSALHKVGQVLLEQHIRTCVAKGMKEGDTAKTLSEFSDAFERFSRMV